MRKTATATIITLVLMIMMTACSMMADAGEHGGESPQITAIKFEKDKVTVDASVGSYLKFQITPAGLQNKASVSWSYDSEIISIDPDRNGVVIKGKKEGQTYLKATANGITATALITVTGNPDIYEGEPYLYSNTPVIEVTAGSTATAQVSLYGGSSEDLEGIRWSIKDPDVAEISSARGNCLITARKVGTTQLVAEHDKAEYPYTILIHSYTDDMREPFITTAQNIVVINKALENSKTITFEVRNPVSENYQRKFSYEAVAKNGKAPCFEVDGNGGEARITPVANGLSILRVSNEDCAYSLDVLVKVATAVQNVYIVPSATTLQVIGSEKHYSLFAGLEGIDHYDPEKFVWTMYDKDDNEITSSDCMDWSSGGNQLTVTGKKNGVFKVKVSHESAEYSRKILIVLREQAGSAIDASMYITTSSNYVQTQVGAEPTTINVQLMGGEPGDENGLVWTIENGRNNDICEISTPTGTVNARSAGSVASGTLVINPRNPGTARITVSHEKILYDTEIMVKVYSEYALLEEPAYINAETSVHKIVNGMSKQVAVTISGNTVSGDENGIVWSSENESKVKVSPPTGPQTEISATGSGKGQTYVSAAHEKALAPKKLLILTADSQDELDAMKAIYTDTNYIRVNENADKYVELNQIGLETTDVPSISWTTEDPSVAIPEPETEDRLKAKVKGIKPGRTRITASIADAAPCVIDVTVVPEGESTEVIKAQYLTTDKNAVVIPKPGQTANLSVTGVNIAPEQMTETLWKTDDEQTATVLANGEKAEITAVSNGKTRATVTNPNSQNKVEINIKVGAIYEWTDDMYEYITTEEDTVAMVKGQTKTIGAALANAGAQSYGFSWTIDKTEIAAITGSASGKCVINAEEAGMAEITIRHQNADFEKTILLVVSNTAEELAQLMYLTTDQNVVTVGETYNETVTVKIRNAAENIISGYHWASSNPEIISVSDSGSVAVLYGKKAGNAKITVTNDRCDYPLEIIANCVDPVLAAQNPYITSPNIVTLTVGDPAEKIAAQLVGGNESDNTGFEWTVKDPETVRLLSANEEAELKALKEGVTQILISHPKANGIDRAVLVICEPKITQNCDITVTESIIKMKPSDSARTIKATLVNGSERDSYAFKWWADNYDIIDMNYANESCVITPLSSGVTTLHIKHPKCPYTKDINLYISEFTNFQFEETNMDATAGTQTFARIQVPATSEASKVIYESYLQDGKTNGSEILGVSGTNTTCILEPRREGVAIVRAKLVKASNSSVQLATPTELLVNIKKAENSTTYIKYQGPTIITLEKGERQDLTAELTGNNVGTNDSSQLKWKSSDPEILRVTPSPSLSGWTMNRDVQITALQAGKEATITVTHSKADSDLIIYVIIPGENTANIMLDHTKLNLIMGDNPVPITASITNAQENDYDKLDWQAEQDENDPVIKISGSGKKISVIAKRDGTARLTATVPSSGRKAVCEITVEKPKQISLDKNSFRIFPGKEFEIHYTTSPESEASDVKWTYTDSSFVQLVNDDHKGTATFVGKNNQGTCTVTGTTKSYASASFTVINEWGNTFEISKTMINTIPVDNHDGTFTVNYKISPSCSEIYVAGLNHDAIELEEGLYDSYDNSTNTYIITPAKYDRPIDEANDTATGTLRLIPKGEWMGQVTLTAYNPTRLNGKPPVGKIADKTMTINVYYKNHTFELADFTTNGKYSAHDQETGIIVIGDGERISFTPRAREKNATPRILSVELDKSQQIKKYEENNGTLGQVTGINPYELTLIKDFSKENGYWDGSGGAAADVQKQYNRTRLEHIYAGLLKINYSPVYGEPKVYSVPVYLDIRDCKMDY